MIRWIVFFLKPTIMINSPVPISAPFLVNPLYRIITVFYFVSLEKPEKNQMIHKMKLWGLPTLLK
jgi:hypothetical protein